MKSCYEAGRDGFWIHRALLAAGVENVVVDSASIEVSRRRRRAKTDRLDGAALLGLLARYVGGEERVWRVVHVPPPEAEEARREGRELERLKKERTGHTNRVRGLLVLHGIRCASLRGLKAHLGELRDGHGQALGEFSQTELGRECERLELVERQIGDIEKARAARVKAARAAREKATRTARRKAADGAAQTVKRRATKARVRPAQPAAGAAAATDGAARSWDGLAIPINIQKVEVLQQLRGICGGAWILVEEFFGWRVFRNGKQVGSLAGLTGTPYASGDTMRDAGISKAGNPRVRAVMVELAWGWLRLQPQSQLSRWYLARFGSGKRNRRVGIVALARKLLIALWRFVEQGVVPEGAVLKTAA